VFSLIKHADSITPPPKRIVYCYGEFQPSFAEFPTVEFQEGLPNVDRFDGQQRMLLITDDLMNEFGQKVSNLFTKLSHHGNMSVVFITQNLFPKNKFVRTINLSTHCNVLFKNPRDAGQVPILARQMYPRKSQIVMEAYENATKEPQSYLLIDPRPTIIPNSHENIPPRYQTVYLPPKRIKGDAGKSRPYK
jgi:hypothetical protein